jgi:hypothetical protein
VSRWFAAGPAWYLWLVLIVTAVAGPVIAIRISSANQRQSEQAWCGLLSVLNEGYTEPAPAGTPPLTARGKKIAVALAEIQNTYRCS